MNKSCNVMILGGNGFIGQNLAAHLAGLGYAVTVFDLKAPEKRIDGVNCLEGDFFDDRSLDVLTEGQDVVIHALSTVNPGNSNAAYLRGYSQDFVQTIKLFDRLTRTRGKLLYLSSAGTVYGRFLGKPFEESDPLHPINHYGSIKLCVETAMRAFNEQQGTRFMSCRISNPYGPGQDFSRGVGFIDAVVKSVLYRQKLEVWGDGSVVRDYIYIGDVCRMMEALLRYDGPMQTFNLSTGVGTSQREIIALFERLGFHVDAEYQAARTVDAKYNIANNRKIETVTGVSCLTLEQGVTEYLKWMKML